MPGYAGALTDDQVVALVRFLRSDVAKAPPWRDVEGDVQQVKREMERKLVAAETGGMTK
jgi:hypothetical protein